MGIKRLNIMDEAELRLAARTLFREKSPIVFLQTLYELMKAAEIFSDVWDEETGHEKEKRI